MKKHIPNTITSLNLISGFFSITLVLTGHVTAGVYLLFLAALFDFSDGFSARLLNVYSPLGKQLDSLADMVSFGIAPAVILYEEISLSLGQTDLPGAFPTLSFFLLLSPAFIALGAGLRLAKFNIDAEQENYFRGLPTPASALFFASIPLLRNSGFFHWHFSMLENAWFLSGLSLLFGFLMICRLPMFSLKFKGKSPRRSIPVIIFLILSAVLFFVFFLKALFIIVILYIFMALVLYFLQLEK